MQILNNVPSTFFPLNSTRSTSNDPSVRIARDTINQAGSSRESKRDILFKASNKRQVPALNASGPLAAFRVNDAIALLSIQSATRKIPIIADLEKKERFSLLKLRQLDDLSISLKSLGQTVSGLLAEGVLNPKKATSTRSERVQAVARKNAPLNTFRVTPVRLAKSAILVSDEQSTPLGTLGLTGSFFINGVKTTVTSSDTLIDLKNKINFGEDHNRNGVLDKTEDINNNGTLDIIQRGHSEFVPSLFITEDLDGDGEIDPDEDINDNGTLDGGTAESKVLALIQDNRLVLVGQAGGRDRIDLLDNDNVLLGLGFFELNIKGFPVQKEVQFDAKNLGVNLIEQPQTAKIEIDGKPVFSDTNVFSEVVEDTDLVIKKASEKVAQITVSIEASVILEQIKTLFEQFNNAIFEINNLLGISRTFAQDGDIQDIRNDLTLKPQERVRKLAKRDEDIDTLRGRPGNPFATGIKVVNTEKDNPQEVAVTFAIEAIKSGMTRVFQSENKNLLLRRLGSIGIRTLEDNTFALDEEEFRRGLDFNTTEIFDLFTNPETGILPTLEERLKIILRDDLGELAIEETEIIVQSSSPRTLAQNFRKFTENANLENTIQTLIAVA